MSENENETFESLFSVLKTLFWYQEGAWVPRVARVSTETASALLSGAGKLEYQEVLARVDAKKESPFW